MHLNKKLLWIFIFLVVLIAGIFVTPDLYKGKFTKTKVRVKMLTQPRQPTYSYPPGSYTFDHGVDIRDIFGEVAVGAYWNPACGTARDTVIVNEDGTVSIKRQVFAGLGTIGVTHAVATFNQNDNVNMDYRNLVDMAIKYNGTKATFRCIDRTNQFRAGSINIQRISNGSILSQCDAILPDESKDKCLGSGSLREQQCPDSEITLEAQQWPTSNDITCTCEDDKCISDSCYIRGGEICTRGASTENPDTGGNEVCESLTQCAGNAYIEHYCNPDIPGFVQTNTWICQRKGQPGEAADWYPDTCVESSTGASCPNDKFLSQ